MFNAACEHLRMTSSQFQEFRLYYKQVSVTLALLGLLILSLNNIITTIKSSGASFAQNAKKVVTGFIQKESASHSLKVVSSASIA
ncbi:hypothetical protein ABEB36_015201 [Hypothenemus hampei]|uniref:Uncharacterized protein n=1 Tax=Hypothenemus hampei TaxID=57062 RepID=A0ABD1E5A7_HYPHA